METKLEQEINGVLEIMPEYWDRGILLKNKVIDDLRNHKPELISALLKNDLVKRTYSINTEGIIIFKIEEFISMLRYKKYWGDSYTKFSNAIGLTSDNKYLKYDTDIVLDFPYKDCVLEGGMTKEANEKKEIYYHNILAKEEIDVIFAPKVFTNIKKYTQNDLVDIVTISDNDNLIIKGNNLIALHTLKKRFLRKVKLIYIDPPYNTGNDSFKYNDRFNHSTWLTFMKNRLEVAKELLSEDGSICINIDDDESHYLKVLVDEIFGRDNFISNVIWQKKYSPQNDARYFSDMHDHLLFYAKNKDNFTLNLLPRSEEMNNRYKNPDNDPRGPWKPSDFSVRTYSKEYDYPITTPSGRVINPPKSRCWRSSKQNFEKLIEDNRVWFGENGDNVPSTKRFLSEVKQGMTPSTIWSYQEVSHNQEARKEISNLLSDDSDFSTPKPERLLRRIIHLCSNPNDIVLDFFMGSATTQAVAMKMNRRFIGIEQMDYIKDVSVIRLQQVISGEQGGISKELNWQGGGSFIYAELYELNKKYVDDILNLSNETEVRMFLDALQSIPYLNIRVELEKLLNNLEGFFELELGEQKNLLIQVLDNNQLYLSYSEIEDCQYAIDEQTKLFNDSFYQKGE